MKRILIACAALLLVAGCSKDSSPTAPIATTGKLTVRVIDVQTQAGVANAAVQLTRTGPSPLTMGATTDASGRAAFVVTPGFYTIHVTPPDGYTGNPFQSDGTTGVTIAAGMEITVTLGLAKQQ